MTEDTIRRILSDVGVEFSSIERNPATPDEWVVWSVMGFPVYDVEDVETLAERLGDA